MTLMKVVARVGQDGIIKIPSNFSRAAGLEKGQLVEIKITGATKNKNISISHKKNMR